MVIYPLQDHIIVIREPLLHNKAEEKTKIVIKDLFIKELQFKPMIVDLHIKVTNVLKSMLWQKTSHD